MPEGSSQQGDAERGESDNGTGVAPGTEFAIMLLPLFVIGGFAAAALGADLLTTFGIIALGFVVVVLGLIADLIVAALFRAVLWVANRVEARWSA
jgi:hypothetical protein